MLPAKNRRQNVDVERRGIIKTLLDNQPRMAGQLFAIDKAEHFWLTQHRNHDYLRECLGSQPRKPSSSPPRSQPGRELNANHKYNDKLISPSCELQIDGSFKRQNISASCLSLKLCRTNSRQTYFPLIVAFFFFFFFFLFSFLPRVSSRLHGAVPSVECSNKAHQLRPTRGHSAPEAHSLPNSEKRGSSWDPLCPVQTRA